VSVNLDKKTKRYLTYRDRHHSVRNKQLLVKMKHQASIKMTSALNCLRLSADFFNLLHSFDPLPDPVLVFAVQPLLVITAHIHRTFEDLGPLEMGGVKVGVADHYSFQTALSIDKLDSGRVDPGNNVPENVALFRLNENSALTYAELFACRSRARETRGKLSWGFRLGGDEVDA
jgi:hypothetical protein